MEKPLTTTSAAILGLLATRSWTTYELAKQAQRSLRWFWPRAERKLYDEPKRLAAAGLATAATEQTGRRRGTRYTITPKGRRALKRWLSEPPAAPQFESDGMVKVFFADAGSLAQLRAALQHMADDARARIAELESMASETLTGRTMFPQRLHLSALTLPFGHHQEQATLQWATWALEQTATWTSVRDPGAWSPEAALRQMLAQR